MGEHLLSSRRATLPAQTRWTQRVALGTRIRNARAAAGMTRSELAHGLTSTAYLSRIETSERLPSQALLADLAARLRVDASSLTRGESTAAEGLRFELAHADLLLASGHFDDAVQVSGDLTEVATCIGAAEVAGAARVVRAAALAASGQQRAALRLVYPLANGTTGMLALVAAARIHLELAHFGDAIHVGHQVVAHIAVPDRLSAPEAADLAVTLCDAYRAVGRDSAADHVARLALEHLPADVETGCDRSAQGAALIAVSYQSFNQVVRHTERAVADLQVEKLRTDIARLRAHVSSGRDRTTSPYPTVQPAVR